MNEICSNAINSIRSTNRNYAIACVGMPIAALIASAVGNKPLAMSAVGITMGASTMYFARRNEPLVKLLAPKASEKNIFKTSALISSVGSTSLFILAGSTVAPAAIAGAVTCGIYSGWTYYNESKIFDHQDIRFNYI